VTSPSWALASSTENLVLALLVAVALFSGGLEEPPASPRPLTIPGQVRWSDEVAEIRLEPNGATYPVAAGVQLTGRIHGAMTVPLTDPGRTLIRVELLFPLLAKNGKTILLPVGTLLTGKVHLLHGDFRFIDFQTFLLPDGRMVELPDEVFRLGPGSLISVQEGTPAILTVARPLRMEAFGQSR
jgi:hypothetical protein